MSRPFVSIVQASTVTKVTTSLWVVVALRSGRGPEIWPVPVMRV